MGIVDLSAEPLTSTRSAQPHSSISWACALRKALQAFAPVFRGYGDKVCYRQAVKKPEALKMREALKIPQVLKK
jgi:hypothetical protein